MVTDTRKRLLILAGYGAFGARIARMLSNEPDIHITITGRDQLKAERCAAQLPCPAEGIYLERDTNDLADRLQALGPDLLIHCAGPFQQQTDYRLARACIESRTPYIDIADARRYVCDFGRLSPAAEAAGITMISGASSLPALSSAVLQQIQRELPTLHAVDIAIAPAQRTELGLATARAGFESLGEGFPLLQNGHWRETHAGNHLRRLRLAHPVGERWLCDFDVPDLELFPRHLPQLRSARFATGVESRTLQLGLALCARLARLNLPAPGPSLARLAHRLAAIWPGGSDHGGMRICVEGENQQGEAESRRWQILGLNGDSPWIAAAPAAAMARKLLRGEYHKPGASACWQLLTLDEILTELTSYAVVTALETLAAQPQPVPASA